MSWRVFILAILVAACVGGAYYLLSEKPASEFSGTTQFVYGFSDDASAISEVTIEVPSGVRFKARLTGGQWQATHLADGQTFPVDHVQLQKLVEQVSQARILERKTSNPRYYERLGVASPDAAEANANLVTFKAATSRYAIHVGKPSEHGSGQFVREKGAAQVVLIDNLISMPRTPTDWLRKDIMPFSIEALTAVRIQSEQGAEQVFTRNEEAQWVWQGQDETQALRYPTVVKDAVASMLAINYEGVAAFKRDRWDSQTELASIRFDFENGEQRVAHLSTASDTGTHQLWIEAPDADRWLNNWVFTLAAYHAEALLVDPDSLVMTTQASPDA